MDEGGSAALSLSEKTSRSARANSLLSALSAAERQDLADLLRRLLTSFEAGTTNVAESLGMTLEPARLARTRRQAVGLSDRIGMLVAGVRSESAAAAAGIERGDLLIEFDGAAVTCGIQLASQLEGLQGRRRVPARTLRGDEEILVNLELPA